MSVILPLPLPVPASTDLPPPSHSQPGSLVHRARVAPRPCCFVPSMHTAVVVVANGLSLVCAWRVGSRAPILGVVGVRTAFFGYEEESARWGGTRSIDRSRAPSNKYRPPTNAGSAERGGRPEEVTDVDSIRNEARRNYRRPVLL